MTKKFYSILLGAMLCSISHNIVAAQIRTARFLTKPEYIFVNQSFELFVEVELTVGCEVQNLQFTDFTMNAGLFTLGSFEALPKMQRAVEGGKMTVDVLRFKTIGQATGVGEHPVRTRLQCQLVERTGGGFFSSFFSRAVQCNVEPFVLRIQAVPEVGKPANFSGAVGTFTVQGKLSSSTAQPGDILTLTTSVEGEGDLRPATLPVPSRIDGFKIYPLKEVTREMSLLRAEQIVIPQSTNATEIGAISFSFFNPVTRTFEVAKAGPFKICFTDKPAKPIESAVRVIDTAIPSRSDVALGQGVTLEQVNKGLHDYLHLVIPALALLIACFIFFQCYGAHTRLGVFLAILLVGAGIFLGYHARQTTTQRMFEVNARTTVMFAPSRHAKTLFVLQPRTQVLPLETAGDWKRIEVNGQRGWIESSPLNIK
jgi:hypothetical protein